jgi:hypothetical protein
MMAGMHRSLRIPLFPYAPFAGNFASLAHNPSRSVLQDAELGKFRPSRGPFPEEKSVSNPSRLQNQENRARNSFVV